MLCDSYLLHLSLKQIQNDKEEKWHITMGREKLLFKNIPIESSMLNTSCNFLWEQTLGMKLFSKINHRDLIIHAGFKNAVTLI